jgi:hypothetical protein
MRARFDPTSPLAYSGCGTCSEYREEALRRKLVHGTRQCLNCSTSRKNWKRWGKCAGCRNENVPLELDHVLGRKYHPVILEPLCRNCHRVKTVLTDHLPNDGDPANLKERAVGTVLAYMELCPDEVLHISSFCTVAGALLFCEIAEILLNCCRRIFGSCRS